MKIDIRSFQNKIIFFFSFVYFDSHFHRLLNQKKIIIENSTVDKFRIGFRTDWVSVKVLLTKWNLLRAIFSLNWNQKPFVKKYKNAITLEALINYVTKKMANFSTHSPTSNKRYWHEVDPAWRKKRDRIYERWFCRKYDQLKSSV